MILIKGGEIVNAEGSYNADVYVEDGIIREIGQHLDVPKGTKVMDAKGALVMPGGIDCHTHLELEYMGGVTKDNFYTGTRAALAGGVTMIIDMLYAKKNVPLLEEYNTWRRRADNKVCCDYTLQPVVSWWNEDQARAMETLAKEEGINGFKIIKTYRNAFMLTDFEMLEVMKHCKTLGAVPLVNTHDGDEYDLRAERLINAGITTPLGHYLACSEEADVLTTHKAIWVAEKANCPVYIVHIASKGVADTVANANKNGNVVFGEAMVCAMGEDNAKHAHEDFKIAACHLTAPPIREDYTTGPHLAELFGQEYLHVMGSDTCIFSEDQKAHGKDDFRKIPHGVNGVEEMMMVTWEKCVNTGFITKEQFVAVTSANTAKIWNMYPRKGCIAVGSDADILVWDPRMHKTISAATHNTSVDVNVFEGLHVTGAPRHVLARGRQVVENGKLQEVKPGAGKFVSRSLFGYAYDQH